jgi:hypothetical protein
MTSLANITKILLLLNTFIEVESKRIHIDFIGCYKRPDVVALADSSTNRLYYPIYRNKRMSSCPCHQKQWCRFGLDVRGSGRRARVITANEIENNNDVLNNDDRTLSSNDTPLPPLPPVTMNLIVRDQATTPSITCSGRLYLNGKTFTGDMERSGLYECWKGRHLLRQDYVRVIAKKEQEHKKLPDKSRCQNSSLVCFNGGECVRGARSLNKPICQCASGFTGVNCSQRIMSFDLK